MTEQGFKRKSIAILSADIEGYSHLTAGDETAARKIIAIFAEAMDSLISRHEGRIAALFF
jgi:class 3 adenylate cyclase